MELSGVAKTAIHAYVHVGRNAATLTSIVTCSVVDESQPDYPCLTYVYVRTCICVYCKAFNLAADYIAVFKKWHFCGINYS